MQKALRQKQKYTLFTAKALAALIIPIVVESALSMSLGMIDGLMASNGVSGEGNKILSAITSVDQVSSLLIQLFAATLRRRGRDGNREGYGFSQIFGIVRF